MHSRGLLCLGKKMEVTAADAQRAEGDELRREVVAVTKNFVCGAQSLGLYPIVNRATEEF